MSAAVLDDWSQNLFHCSPILLVGTTPPNGSNRTAAWKDKKSQSRYLRVTAEFAHRNAHFTPIPSQSSPGLLLQPENGQQFFPLAIRHNVHVDNLCWICS